MAAECGGLRGAVKLIVESSTNKDPKPGRGRSVLAVLTQVRLLRDSVLEF